MQTEYNLNMKAPSPGTISSSDYDTITGISEVSASTGIAFGVAVAKGTADKGVVLGGALSVFLGITVKDIALGHKNNVDVYHQYDNVSIMRRGTMWVEAGEPVTANDPVHYDATTGVLMKSGGTGPIPGARWVRSAGVGERTEVYLSGITSAGI